MPANMPGFEEGWWSCKRASWHLFSPPPPPSWEEGGQDSVFPSSPDDGQTVISGMRAPAGKQTSHSRGVHLNLQLGNDGPSASERNGAGNKEEHLVARVRSSVHREEHFACTVYSDRLFSSCDRANLCLLIFRFSIHVDRTYLF